MSKYFAFFSSGSPENVEPICITLPKDAETFHLRLRNYSQEQRRFLVPFMSLLVTFCMAYFNQNVACAYDPLFVQICPAFFRFTVNLRPVDRFTLKIHFGMLHIEHELPKLASLRLFSYLTYRTVVFSSHWNYFHKKSSPFLTLDGSTLSLVCYKAQECNYVPPSSLATLLLAGIHLNILRYLDDSLIHAGTTDD